MWLFACDWKSENTKKKLLKMLFTDDSTHKNLNQSDVNWFQMSDDT